MMARASDPQHSELVNLLVQNLGVGAPHTTSKEDEIGLNGPHNGQNSVPSYHKEVGGQRKQLRESGGDFNPFGTPYFQSSLSSSEQPGRDQEWQEYVRLMNLGATASPPEGPPVGRDHQTAYSSGNAHFGQTPSPYAPPYPSTYYPTNYMHPPTYTPNFSPTYAPPYPSYPSSNYPHPYRPPFPNGNVAPEPYRQYSPSFGYSAPPEESSPPAPLLHTFEAIDPPLAPSEKRINSGKSVPEELSIDQANGHSPKQSTDQLTKASSPPPPSGGSGKSRSWASIALTAKTSPETSPSSDPKAVTLKSGTEPKVKPTVTPATATNGFLPKKEKSSNIPNAYGPAVDPNLVTKYPLLAGVNSTTIDCAPSFARFFVIKSYSEDDIHKSIKYNIWASTDSGNRRLDNAFKDSAAKGPIYLFFSVNASGQFCGLAQMVSPLDYNTKSNVWAQDKWNGQFKVKWLLIKDISNSHLRHIKLTNNENKPVTNSRDTQEILFEPGKEMLRLFLHFKSKNSLLEDFSFYDKRQEEMAEKKEKKYQEDDRKSPEN